MADKLGNGFDDLATVEQSHPLNAPEIATSFALAVVEGPDLGTIFRIDAAISSRVLMGQSPACEFRLTDRQISRRHVAFELGVSNALRVTDLRSLNGTFVNGTSILDALVRGGELVKLGETVVRVDRLETTAIAPPSLSMGFGKLVGVSPAMRKLYPLFEKIALSSLPAIVEGETGTGKEALAEALHEKGPRAKNPFLVFDSAGTPASAVDGVLFGDAESPGLLAEANGGTLLVDEIGDLDLALQAKLVRVIERSQIQRSGLARATNVDVRIIATTRKNLDREVQEGRFRDDLFFRLAALRIELPPLRARKGDVPFLAHYFWERLAPHGQPFAEELLTHWLGYAFPGNVRELKNGVARRLALAELPSNQIEGVAAKSIGGEMDRVLELDLTWTNARQRVVDTFARLYIERALQQSNGNVVRASAASGLARRYFQILRAKQK